MKYLGDEREYALKDYDSKKKLTDRINLLFSTKEKSEAEISNKEQEN